MQPSFQPPRPELLFQSGENREENIGIFFQDIIKEFHYIVKGGQSQVKQKT